VACLSSRPVSEPGPEIEVAMVLDDTQSWDRDATAFARPRSGTLGDNEDQGLKDDLMEQPEALLDRHARMGYFAGNWETRPRT